MGIRNKPVNAIDSVSQCDRVEERLFTVRSRLAFRKGVLKVASGTGAEVREG